MSYKPFKVNLQTFNKSSNKSVSEMEYLVQKLNWTDNNMMNAECNIDEGTNPKISVFTKNYNLTNCRSSCLVTAPRSEICSNLKKEIPLNTQRTFWLYLFFRLLFGQ